MKNSEITKLFVLSFLLTALSAQAATRTWDNDASDQVFTNATNWSGDTLPGASDIAVVDTATAGESPILDAAHTVKYLRVGRLSGNTGSLEIATGGNLTGTASTYIGEQDNAMGTVNVTGGTLALQAATALGRYGTGNLNISAGSVNATSFASSYYAGSASAINMTGGTFTTTDYVIIGKNSDSTMNLSGGTFNPNSLMIGQSAGTGQFVISGDAVLNVATDLRGWDSNFKFKMVGSDAQVNVTGDIRTLEHSAGATSLFEFVLNGASGVGDGIAVDGDITLEDSTTIDLSFMGATADGTYTLMSSGGTFTNLSHLSASSVAAGWSTELVDVGGGITELQATIPEPATLGLFALSATALAFLRRLRL